MAESSKRMRRGFVRALGQCLMLDTILHLRNMFACPLVHFYSLSRLRTRLTLTSDETGRHGARCEASRRMCQDMPTP